MAHHSRFKKSHLDGNSLLVVLVFLFLSASIVMMASIASALELKMAGQFNEKNEVFRVAEGALNQVAYLLMKKPSCYQAMQPIQVLRAHPAVWWLQLGSDCRLDQGKIKVRFIIEPFEHDPCLQAKFSSSFPRRQESSHIPSRDLEVLTSRPSRDLGVLSEYSRLEPLNTRDPGNKKKISSLPHLDFFRITIFAMSANHRSVVRLQAVYSVISFSQNKCLGSEQQIRVGRQSWIEF